ncbi:MAG: PD-(D/E)XK nuclease family protein [Clostridia bacterium]|nr:PD-(D/E)XK nuclease family protein [Clostridia bacterium]
MLSIWGGTQETLRRHLIAQASQAQKMLVIVPEQYTLQTERELLDGLNAPGFFDLEVLSPSRLTERVFAQAGSDGRVRIDARGKQLALARALLQCKKQLKYYESVAEKQGFIERAGTLIADFKRAGVTPQALAEHACALPDGASKDKLNDLALLFTAYSAQLAGQFVDGEDVLDHMLFRLPDSSLVTKDTHVAVYGFDVFTGQMNRLLLSLSALSQDVQALIVLGREEMFSPVLESARRLQKAAQEAQIACRFAFLPPAEDRRPPELIYLSSQYLVSPGQAYPGPVPAIRLYASANPYFEAHFVAQEMLLLNQRGMAFGDMALAMGDPGFAGTLATVLASYKIPAYVTRKLPAATHGAARFLLFSLKAAAGGYDAADMLTVLKSGYAPIGQEDAWRLENYILSYGIRGKLWLNPFARGSAEECARIEAARQALITPLETLRLTLKQAPTAGDALRGVYDYLEITGVFDALTQTQEALMTKGMAAEAVQARQVWEAMMQLLSQAHALLGDAKVTAKQLSSWLEAGMASCELSSLPPTADAVMCGEIGSLPLAHPRVLFLTNLTDGILSAPSPGLLTVQEQEDAEQSLHAYLSLNDDGKDCLARLDVWKALSAPTEKLYLTRAQATEDGGALRPFASLSHIRRLFPALVEEGGVMQRSAAALPLAPGPALDALGMRAREGTLDGEWLNAWKYLCQHPDTRSRAEALCRAFLPESSAPPLPREITRNLFMERIMSVSRLENFAVCPYKHFVDQGLSPKPRKEWTVTPIDAGNFYHNALEGFTRLLPTIPNWPKIDKKTCDAAVDQAAGPLFEQLLSGPMGDSARMKALGGKYRRVLRRVAWTFTRGAKQSAFKPENAEVKFGYPGDIPPIELTLKDGRKVFIRGMIDRIDRYAGDEGVFLRVVDYKSGSEKLSPTRIFWGAQLQLLLYLKAALTMEKDAQPAGAFYMHVADPLVPDRDDLTQIEDALAKELCLKGVALKDAVILHRMDDGTPPLTLPKMLNADGSFSKTAPLATLSDLRSLIGHAEGMAAQWAEKIHAGQIAASPLCDQNGDGPCRFCDYAAICRKSTDRSPENARITQEMKFDELLEKVNKKFTGNSEENKV